MSFDLSDFNTLLIVKEMVQVTSGGDYFYYWHTVDAELPGAQRL